jgi:CheY-like chemotaxis protein
MSQNRSISSTRSLRILVAEDNDLNRKVTLAMLERLGHRADIAVDGIEVLQALEHQQYDLILMNICMPL